MHDLCAMAIGMATGIGVVAPRGSLRVDPRRRVWCTGRGVAPPAPRLWVCARAYDCVRLCVCVVCRCCARVLGVVLVRVVVGAVVVLVRGTDRVCCVCAAVCAAMCGGVAPRTVPRLGVHC